MRIVKTDGLLAVEAEQLAYLGGLAAEFVEHTCLTEDELITECADADALMVLREPVTARVIASLRRCRVIGRFGVGLDSIDVSAARAKGIVVTHVPDSNIEEVGAHALALILALTRRLFRYDRAVRSGRWDFLGDGAGITRLQHQRLGIVGLGRIGLVVATRAAALGFNVLVHDPYRLDSAIADAGFTPVGFDRLVAEADVLSLHLPLSPATRNLISADVIARMKRGAIIVNVSRGGLVDEAALAAALVSGQLAGAGIDTLGAEPPLSNHPLLQVDNVILTPHAAHYSVQSYSEVRNKVFADVAAVLRGESPRYPVRGAGE